jgi:hypothetical protein
LEFNFNTVTPTIYTISGMRYESDGITLTAVNTYTFAPDLSTTTVFLSTVSQDLQPYVKTIKLKAINEYSPGVYTQLYTGDTVYWWASSYSDPTLAAIRAEYTSNGNVYTFGTVVDSTIGSDLTFYLTGAKSTTPDLCSYCILMSVITGGGPDLTAIHNFSFYEYPADSIFDPTFRINYENPREVNENMWRLTGTYIPNAYDISYIPKVAAG